MAYKDTGTPAGTQAQLTRVPVTATLVRPGITQVQVGVIHVYLFTNICRIRRIHIYDISVILGMVTGTVVGFMGNEQCFLSFDGMIL